MVRGQAIGRRRPITQRRAQRVVREAPAFGRLERAGGARQAVIERHLEPIAPPSVVGVEGAMGGMMPEGAPADQTRRRDSQGR